jgi:hypothetical protein
MKNSDGTRNPRRLVIICVALIVFASLPFLSSAHAPSISVNIVNNSNREIRNVYLSHVGADDWGNDQLGESVIAPGHSFTINAACDQQQVKVIGEDEDGCFVSTVVSCSAGSTWTVTSDTARDCGN